MKGGWRGNEISKRVSKEVDNSEERSVMREAQS